MVVWRPFKRQTNATCSCTGAKVKVRVFELGLLLPRLNRAALSVTTAPLNAVCANASLYKRILSFTFFSEHYSATCAASYKDENRRQLIRVPVYCYDQLRPCLWRTHQPSLAACSWTHQVQGCSPGIHSAPRLCTVVLWPVQLRCRPTKSPRASLFLQRLPRPASGSPLHCWQPSIFGCWPQVWNCLPADITSAPSLTTFCTRLETFLFTESYPDIWLIGHFCVYTLDLAVF